MSIDVTSLSISVASTGIKEAATALEALSVAASKVEGKTKTIKEATSGLSSSQAASVASIEKLIAGFQKQTDLLGANTSQMNAYAVAMKNGTQLEQAMASMLGAEVDAYKAKGIAQQQAIKDNQALDASYKKLQQEADAFYASQAKAQAAGNALNAAGVQANEYKKLANAQAEAIKMNNALDASNKRLETDHGKAIIEDKARAYAALAATQAEAIKMNNALDASIRKLNQDEAARKQVIFNTTLQQGHDLARGLSGSLGALWLTYGNIGMMIAGVAIGASLKEAVTGFAKVEYQMTFVKALAEDTTHSVAELTARMHDVAGALGIAPEAAAKGLRALTQAGLNTSDALATLPVAFKLATVGELALEQAALAATGVMNAYDLKVSSLEHIGDVMAKAGAMSAASVDSISVSMKYSAGTAEQYGVSLEKLGAILTLLGKRGITGSSAGVAANNLIAELYSPSSEKAIKAAAALGVKAYVDGVRQPIEDVVKSFKDGLGKFDSESQGMLLEAYFGKKGGKAFYALAQGTKEEFKALETQLVNSTGFVADVYKANLKTVEGQLNLTKSAITNMFSKVGEESSEPIKELLVSIRNMASSQAAQDMFVGLTQSIKTFITVVVPAALAVGSFFAAAKVGTMVVAGWTAAMAFLESTIAIGLIPTIKALNIAMMSNPVGLLIGLVSTLAAAYFLLKRNKESVHDLHAKDMANAAETLKAGEDEIKMLERQLALRNQNIRGDGEASELKKMEAQEGVQRIQQKILDNNTKYYEQLGKAKNAGSFNAGGPKENIQLEKDLVEAQKTYSALEAQSTKINGLKQRMKAENDRMDAEDLAKATPKVIGTQKYGGNDKGLKAAASDAYAEAIAKEQGLIKASKTAMQNFEDTQNNLFKAGEIGKLKFIQEVGDKQVEELAKQHKAIEAQIAIASDRKNGKADGQKFADELVANEQASRNAKIKAAEETNVQLAKYAEDNTRFQIQQLETQGKFGEAAALKFSSENKLAFKQAEQDLADFGDKFPIITERYKELKSAQREAIAAGENKEAVAAFNNEAESVRNSLKGIQTASEGLGIAAMLEAATEASQRLRDSMPKMNDLKLGITDPKGINEANAQLINLAENQRKLWVGVGESISRSLGDAFGNAGKAAGEMLMVSINTGNVESKLAADKAAALKNTEAAYNEFGFSQYDTAKALNKINLDYTEKEKGVRLKSYGDMANAAKGFFKEGTTGYKVMETAEKAFRLIELAGMAKSLAVTVATAAEKALAWAPAVIMSFMASLGPWGMAAAGVAIAAVLGGAFGGGSAPMSAEQRQKTQGTGSVLGDKDAKSESIANSLSILEKNSGLGLAQGNDMVMYLKTVSDNITSLASLVVRSTGITGSMAGDSKGAAANVLSSTLGTLVIGGFIGLGLDKLLGGFVSKTIGKVANAVFGGNVSTLDTGFTANKASLGSVMTNGLSASQYTDTKKDGGWFSSDKYSTQLASLGPDADGQFSKIITNMAETLKAANKILGIGGDDFTKHLESFVVDIGKISLKDLKGDEIQKALEAVFSKLGDDMAKFAIVGLDTFQKVGEGYLETVVRVATDLIQVKDVFAVLNKTFDLTGIAAITVSEGLITAAGGLDKLTSGTKFFVDNFLTEAERMEPITKSVAARMKELGYAGVTTEDSFKALVRSLDLTDPAAQLLFGKLLDIAPAFKEAADYAQELADGTVSLTKAQQKALDISNKQRELEIQLLEAQGHTLQATAERRKDELAALYKLSPALAATQQQIYNVNDAVDALSKAKTNLDTAYNRESTALQSVIDKFKAFSDTLKKFKDSLLTGDLSTLSPEQKYLQSKAKFESTSALAAKGDAGALGSLQDVSQEFLNASRDYNASTEAYARDFNAVQKGLTDGVKASDRQANIAQSQLDSMKAQYNKLQDIDSSVLSFKDAVVLYLSASATAAATGAVVPAGAGGSPTTKPTGAVPPSPGSPQGQLADYEATYGGNAYYLNEYNNYAAKLALVTQMAEKFGKTVEEQWAMFGHTGAYWKEVQNQWDAGMHPTTTSVKIDGSHFNGLDRVPFDGYTAKMHAGERIQTAKAANASDENSAELVKLTKELLERISNLEEHAGASNTQRGAISEESSEQMKMLIKKMEGVQRKLDVIEARKKN